jgi:uncharacterized protein
LPKHAERALAEILDAQPAVAAIVDRAPALELPGWYLGAGCVTPECLDALHGFDSRFGIKDYDLVYFDRHDLSEQAENRAESRARHLVTDLGVQLDVTIEARVHLWYEEHFGWPIEPYQSSEDAIATWLTTAASVGVRRSHGAFELAGRCDRRVSQVTCVDSILCQYP